MSLNDFIYSPYCKLYLPLWKKDGIAFMSDDAYGHLATVTGALWTSQGRKFNGTADWIDCGDNDIFTPISANQVDIPFSGVAWVNLIDATASCVFGKRASATVLEWIFETGEGNDKLALRLYTNGGTGNYIDALSNTALTADQGNWICVGFSYDGLEVNTGITLYRNGQVFASTAGGVGTYTGMSNTASKLGIGALNDGTADLMDGTIGEGLLMMGLNMNPLNHLRYYELTKGRYQ